MASASDDGKTMPYQLYSIVPCMLISTLVLLVLFGQTTSASRLLIRDYIINKRLTELVWPCETMVLPQLVKRSVKNANR